MQWKDLCDFGNRLVPVAARVRVLQERRRVYNEWAVVLQCAVSHVGGCRKVGDGWQQRAAQVGQCLLGALFGSPPLVQRCSADTDKTRLGDRPLHVVEKGGFVLFFSLSHFTCRRRRFLLLFSFARLFHPHSLLVSLLPLADPRLRPCLVSQERSPCAPSLAQSVRPRSRRKRSRSSSSRQGRRSRTQTPQLFCWRVSSRLCATLSLHLWISGITLGNVFVVHHCRVDFHAAAVQHATTTLTMPALSPTMTEGTITTWKKKEGKETTCQW